MKIYLIIQVNMKSTNHKLQNGFNRFKKLIKINRQLIFKKII